MQAHYLTSHFANCLSKHCIMRCSSTRFMLLKRFSIWLFISTIFYCIVLCENLECDVPLRERMECGYLGITEYECYNRNCCWKESKADYPWCFRKQTFENCAYYEAKSVYTYDDILKVDLALNLKNCSNTEVFHATSELIRNLTLEAHFNGPSEIRLKIKDAKERSFEIPTSILPIFNFKKSSKINESSKNHFISYKVIGKTIFISSNSSRQYVLLLNVDKFAFKVCRHNGQRISECIFDTTGFNNFLMYQELYKKIGTAIPSDANIYGLGEKVGPFKNSQNGTIVTLFNQDSPTFPSVNLYGSHPFYIEMRNGMAHGVFLRNSHGMDITLSKNNITYKVIGGIFDFFILMGPTADQVLQQYSDVVGKPFMIPFWSLGFHQCRYGYKSLNQMMSVVDNFDKHEIPLDTLWMDIDYMNGFENFTLDPKNFPSSQLKEFASKLQNSGRKIIPIIDPGIKIKTGSRTYEDGLNQDIFLKNKIGQPFKGTVWPGAVHYPDFFHPNTQSYWEENLKRFSQICPFNGLWLDMNEISNFCNGECQKSTANHFKKTSLFSIQNPPFRINNSGEGAPLNTKTVDMDAVHFNNIFEYDVHNLFGYMESKATFHALLNIKQNLRPFIISRSTFAGSGYFAGHWTGDNFSDWKNLKNSISSMLNFQIFLIPMVGSDICGFIGDSTEQLCIRWMQLGAFYPFSRNHNSNQSLPQEPYIFKELAVTSRHYLSIRYSLLSYWYTLFYDAHVFGHAVVKPLFFEFPDDQNTLEIDTQFLIGKAILVSPCLTKDSDSVKAYFPKGIWYSFEEEFESFDCSSTGKYIDISAPLQYIPVHVRGGSIVPIQPSGVVSQGVKQSPFTLMIALSADKTSSGTLYMDDGVTYSEQNNIPHNLIQFSCQLMEDFMLYLKFEGEFGFPESPLKISSLQILLKNSTFMPSKVFLKKSSISLPATFSQKKKDRFKITFIEPVYIQEEAILAIF